MKIKLRGKFFSLKQIFCLCLYYGLARFLPCSKRFMNIGGLMRQLCCKGIFKYCGKNVNIERGAIFGRCTDVEIGDNSGIGINAVIPSDTKIGNNVMMGPNCYILSKNHSFDRIDIPTIKQGFTKREKTIIEDDVWIGRDVTMTPGRTIKRGSIVGACCLLCKDFPEFSIIGGNPSTLIRNRK